MGEEGASTQVPVAFHPKVAEEMGGAPPVLVLEKVLEENDVSTTHGYLYLPQSNTLMAALTAEERSKVHNEVGIVPGFLGIVATDPSGEEFVLHLEKWPIKETVLLARDWLVFVQLNRLKPGDTVQAWGYRLPASSEFRLALNFSKIPR